MAEVEKHTNSAMMMLIKHNERHLTGDSNTDIIKERSQLNYSIPLDHGGMKDLDYYQMLVGNSYIYGRGSKREAEAITAFSWVITLPKEVSDYTTADKHIAGYLNPEAERAFFEGVTQFVSNRYGAENLLQCKTHYDEAGQPHIHISVAARKPLDHDLIHYKTQKTKQAIRTETGRWEYTYRFIKDENGERIPVKNYAKMSDYYDSKLSCAEIINPVELKHFHPDLAEYLRKHNLPGASGVHTGVTGGRNISVGAMKEFTRTTGLTIDQVKEIQQDKNILAGRIASLEKDIKTVSLYAAEKDKALAILQERITERELSLEQAKSVATDRAEMEVKLRSKEQELTTMKQDYTRVCHQLQIVQSQLAERTVDKTELSAKDKEIEALRRELSSVKRELREVQLSKDAELAAKDKEIKQLRNKKTVQQTETKEWGTNSGWGQNRGWDNLERDINLSNDKTIEEVK